MRHFGLSISTLAAAVIAASAFADGHATPDLESAVKARQANMSMLGYNTGILGDMAKGELPYDAAMATAAAENLSAAAAMNRMVLWIEGSEQGVVAGTRAKAEIWSDAAGFDERAVALETAAAAMISAAGTDLDQLRAAMGPIGASCGDCHKAYRGPRN